MRLLAEEARKGLLRVSGGCREYNFGTGVPNGEVHLRTEPVEVPFGGAEGRELGLVGTAKANLQREMGRNG